MSTCPSRYTSNSGNCCCWVPLGIYSLGPTKLSFVKPLAKSYSKRKCIIALLFYHICVYGGMFNVYFLLQFHLFFIQVLPVTTKSLHINPKLIIDLVTADILTCLSRKSISVTNDVNKDCILFGCASSGSWCCAPWFTGKAY